MSSNDPSSPISWILPIVLIIILVLLSAFFSLTETAFTCMNQFKMKIKADDGNKSAKLALKMHEKFDKTLISVLIGNNFVAVAVSVISTLFFVWFFNLLGVNESIASIVATIVMTIIVYLFGDTIPKFIARAYPDKIALRVAYISYFFFIIFKPISLIFEGLTFLVNKILRADKKPTMTEEEFTDIVSSIEEEGLLDENESDIIQNTFDFDDTTVKEILTPIEKIKALDIHDLTHEKLNEFIINCDYSRIPIYRGNINNIIGVLNVKLYLKEYLEDNEVLIKKTLQKPYIVSTRIKLESLFDGFRKNHTHIAIVKNKDILVGMVTMEDVLEELVGDMSERTPKMKGGKAK